MSSMDLLSQGIPDGFVDRVHIDGPASAAWLPLGSESPPSTRPGLKAQLQVRIDREMATHSSGCCYPLDRCIGGRPPIGFALPDCVFGKMQFVVGSGCPVPFRFSVFCRCPLLTNCAEKRSSKCCAMSLGWGGLQSIRNSCATNFRSCRISGLNPAPKLVGSNVRRGNRSDRSPVACGSVGL
jgi:hypothetical protein